MYGGAYCPWRLMVGVNDLLCVALECFFITVHWEGDLVKKENSQFANCDLLEATKQKLCRKQVKGL
jgi:hypothetical protein